MSSESLLWRQQDIFVGDTTTMNMTVIGAGGIGSNTVLTLAMMGVGRNGATGEPGSITVWDGDRVEEHNLPNQLFGQEDIGKPKVVALQELVKRQTGLEIVPVDKFWEGERLEGPVISGLDSMAVRQKLWESLKFKMNPLYVDGRMGGEFALIYASRPIDIEDVKFYESELNTDEEATELPCTAQAIIYNTSMIGSLIANIVKRWATGQEFPRELMFDFTNYYLATREMRI